MAEYIEREALLKELKEKHADMMQDEEYYGKKRLWHEALSHARVESIVECQPTADVVEVRHGRVMQLDHDEWWGAIYKCCECNGEFMLGDKKQAKCCPYCGAYLKMDGKDENDG